MASIGNWGERLVRALARDPQSAARHVNWPCLGNFVARRALQDFGGRELLAVADARAASHPMGRLTQELYGKAAFDMGCIDHATHLFANAAAKGRLTRDSYRCHVTALRASSPELAVQCAGSAARRYPKDAAIRMMLAANLWANGDLKGARSAAMKALRLKKKDYREARHFCAYLSYQQGTPVRGNKQVALLFNQRTSFRPAEESIILGIPDTKSPDLATSAASMADHLQTCALLTLIARHDATWQAGSSDLLKLMEASSTGPREPGRPPQAGPSVALVEIDRDCPGAACGRLANRPVWFPVYGAFSRGPFNMLPPIPFPDNIRPIFLAFQLPDRLMLAEPLIGYLKRYEPIGCRDWRTAGWLRNAGVRAFFSGCLTMASERPRRADGPVADGGASPIVVVDPPAGWTAEDGSAPIAMTERSPGLRVASLATSLQQAQAHLERLATAGRVVAGPTATCLAAQALSRPVTLLPSTGRGGTLDFVADLDPATFLRLRMAMAERIRAVFATILSGAGEGEIYRQWQDVCADALAETDRILGQPYRRMTVSHGDVRSARRSRQQRMDIVLAFDSRYLPIAKTMLRSLTTNTSSTPSVHLLTRGVSSDDVRALAGCFASLTFSHIALDTTTIGSGSLIKAHHSRSQFDRLLIPALLPDIDKVIYLDVDSIVRGDIAELLEFDTGPRGIAARQSIRATFRRQIDGVDKFARKARPELSAEVWRRGSSEVDLLGPRFNSGVLVMSLDKLRSAGFVDEAVSLVDRYNIDDEDAFNYFSRGESAPLPACWNAFVYQESLDDAKFVHWVGPAKPWTNPNVPLSGEWLTYARDVPSRPQARGRLRRLLPWAGWRPSTQGSDSALADSPSDRRHA